MIENTLIGTELEISQLTDLTNRRSDTLQISPHYLNKMLKKDQLFPFTINSKETQQREANRSQKKQLQK